MVLVTAFEPFGGDTENASAAAVARLDAGWDGPARLVTELLPVSFAGSGARLQQLLLRHRPDLVLCVGEAGRRRAVSVERWARNLDDARIPDNDGEQPRGVAIDEGPERLPTRLDAAAVVAAVAAAGVAVEASDDAGAFVCNHVFRVLLTATDVPAGFVHVPALRTRGRAQVGAETDPGSAGAPVPELTPDDLATALRVVLLTALTGSGTAAGEDALTWVATTDLLQ
ncbi:pyroglutamyl-peptidase I [Auraticoccus sp. F435]|uniref:Pyrrolidone-carboxylate peptidase n=1 Tax=Auraticoccus cholistanensis TaxID=2656650 RepID=A0A6A9UWC6_9ACTN|nr:pyroglutamyl-peptidase I [Auraticoccus cholistanensis]